MNRELFHDPFRDVRPDCHLLSRPPLPAPMMQSTPLSFMGASGLRSLVTARLIRMAFCSFGRSINRRINLGGLFVQETRDSGLSGEVDNRNLKIE